MNSRRALASRWFESAGLLALVALAHGCATLADSGGGDASPPNARAGPFRELRRDEIGNDRAAPYVLRDPGSFARDVAVLDLDGDPATLPVAVYAARRAPVEGSEPDPLAPTDGIVRHLAEDGRSLDRNPVSVLTPDHSWEGGVLAAPSVLARAAEVWLFYEAAEGIGLARSVDGLAFERAGNGRVLARGGGGWDADLVPRSPSVLALDGGDARMFYAAGGALGEARSDDGLVWTRGEVPVLEPSKSLGELALSGPAAVVTRSALGRAITWLYAAAERADGSRVIVAAAREGDGPFVRAAAPVFGQGGSLGPSEPSVVRFDGFTLLFVTARAGKTAAEAYPAVLAAVAPATALLPPPVP